MTTILIVDDEINILKSVSGILSDEGYSVETAENLKDAENILKTVIIDLVIQDIWLPDGDGTDFISEIFKYQPDTAVIVLSGHGSIDAAIKSTRLGAFDFIEKPPSMDRVITSVANALERARLKKENIKLKKSIFHFDDMIGQSMVMGEIRDTIDSAASTNARVFITGDSGTGKELIARAIYMKSKRSDKPFIKVNCAAIPEELIESELFGHEKGSFTGAIKQRIGKFEQADGGTLFLDEICEMSLSAQSKVLRVLQEHELEKVGGTETIHVDVRVIAATNAKIKEVIDDGTFREDLYYRLNVIPIYAVPLRDRSDDIPLLCNYFIKKFSQEHGTGDKKLSDEAVKFMENFPWEGNVRELKNIIERLVVMVKDDEINIKDVQRYMSNVHITNGIKEVNTTLKIARQHFEKEYIARALLSCQGNVSRTARILGMERTNLHRKINQYAIDINGIMKDE
jgi:two-component system nitrogen regulation response regulator NtrX